MPIGYAAVGVYPVGGFALAAPPVTPGEPPPEGEIDAEIVPVGRRILFEGGSRVLLFEGGTRVVSFDGGTRVITFEGQ